MHGSTQIKKPMIIIESTKAGRQCSMEYMKLLIENKKKLEVVSGSIHAITRMATIIYPMNRQHVLASFAA